MCGLLSSIRLGRVRVKYEIFSEDTPDFFQTFFFLHRSETIDHISFQRHLLPRTDLTLRTDPGSSLAPANYHLADLNFQKQHTIRVWRFQKKIHSLALRKGTKEKMLNLPE